MKYILLFLSLFLTPAVAQISCGSSTSLMASLPSVTVAGLPICDTGSNGVIYIVTNALLPTVLGIVVGGGAVTTLVHCNGTNFVVG